MGRIETVPTKKKTRNVTITFNHTFIITFIKEVQEPSTIIRSSVFKSHLNPLIALNNNCKLLLKNLYENFLSSGFEDEAKDIIFHLLTTVVTHVTIIIHHLQPPAS